jgi:hypothetical protein
MTADDNTHRESVNPTGAHDNDAQRIVALLKKCGGSTKVDYLYDLSTLPLPRLHDNLDELSKLNRIEMHTGLNSVRADLLKKEEDDQRYITDGSGGIEDCQISISANEVFELISAPRRRELIKKISNLTPKGEEDDTHLELKPLATWVLMAQSDTTISELSQSELHRTYVSLSQVHADSLDECGVAEYHKRVKKITPTEEVHSLATIIEAIESATQFSVPE